MNLKTLTQFMIRQQSKTGRDPSAGWSPNLERHQERDSLDNSSSTPPSGGFSSLRVIWAIEFYTLSHHEELISAFQHLGWDKEDRFGALPDPASWVNALQKREYGGSWLNLGILIPEDRVHSYSGYHNIDLPSYFDRSLAGMHSISPSLVCIVTGFVMKDKYVSAFDDELVTERSTYHERVGGGYRVLGVVDQKRESIRQFRKELSSSIVRWYAEFLPGVFSHGLLNDIVPTCEFVTLKEAKPFQFPSSTSPRDFESMLDAIGMKYDTYAWESGELDGLRFFYRPDERDEDIRYHSHLAANYEDYNNFVPDSYKDGKGHPSEEFIKDTIEHLMWHWGVACLLEGYVQHMNLARKSLGKRSKNRKQALEKLNQIEDIVSFSGDVLHVATEMDEYVKVESMRFRSSFRFERCNEFHRKFQPYLDTEILHIISSRSQWLASSDNLLRDYLVQFGSLLGTNENIRLQKSIARLTWTILILAILTVILTVI